MIFGIDSSPELQLHLGDHTLEVVEADKHLGVPLSTNRFPSIESISGNISKGRRSFYASMGLGDKYHPITPLTLSKLYWSISVPQMTYGLELLPLSVNLEQALESAHMSIAKVIQGLPRQTSGPAVLMPMQWLSMHALLAYRRLTLLWRILLLPTESICKQMVVGRVLEIIKVGVGSSPVGPVRVIMESAIEYGLVDLIRCAIISAQFHPISRWKNVVVERIRAVERSAYEAKSKMYVKLSLFCDCISVQFVWPWWIHLQYYPRDTHYCKTILRLMAGEHELRGNGRHASRVCHNCSDYEAEDVPHLLFKCTMYDNLRRVLWDQIKKAAPPTLVLEMETMSPRSLSLFWFSGFHCKYVHEWSGLYSVIGYYIHAVYKERLSLIRKERT
jgi:hypothetical protein